MANSGASRQVLEDELRLVLEQKAAIEARLTQLQSAPGRQAGALAVKTGAGKRPPNVPSKTHVPPTKKQKVDDRQRRFASLWNQMSTVLKQIMKQRDAAHFSQPVDIEKLKVPDYYKIVKVPMDLGTVKQNLEHRPEKGQPRKYDTPAEFCRDVRQVWANCRMYNPEGHQVRGMGDRLSDAWEKKWLSSQIEEKWEALKREEKEDELGPAIVPHRLKEMSAELQELNGKVAAGAPPRGDGPRATFSFEDKRRLSQHLGALPGNKLNRVLEIIAESMELPTNEDGELELDIDALSEKTLVALDEYVGSVMDEAQDKYDKGKAAATSNKGRGEVLQQGQTAEQLAAAAASGAPAQPAAGGAASPLDVADAAAAAVGGSGSGLDPPRGPQQPAAQSAGGEGATAPAAEAASAPAQPSPSSSSSDGSSSSSDDDSMGEVGSKHDGDSAEGGAKGVEAGAEQSTLVSATHPQQAPGIYQQKSRKDVTLQNEGAWGALAAAKPATPATAATPAAAPDGTAPTAAADGAGGAAASAEPGADADDPVWSEFARREQQQKKLAQEKAAEEKARQTAQEQAEEAARKEAAARQAEAAAAAEAERKKAAEAEAAAAAAAEARRKEELAALDAGATDLAGPQDVIGNSTAGNALNALGLKQQDSSSDDSDSD